MNSQTNKILQIVKSEAFMVLLFCIGIFTIYALIVTRLNIHGDSKFHTFYAVVSAEKGELVATQPNRLYRITDGKREYYPITYPLTSQSLLTIFYLFGGEEALKLYAPLMASLVLLLVYLCIREIGRLKAILISAITPFLIGERLLMTPLMEPYVIVAILASLYCIKKFFILNQTKYLYTASIFLGLSVAIKQQGIMLVLFISVFIVNYLITTSIIRKELMKGLITIIFFIMITIAIPSIAIIDQVNRTGTFAFSPGRTELPKGVPFYNIIQPALASKFDTDPRAEKAIQETVTYNRKKVTFLDKLEGFVLSPFLFYRSIEEARHTALLVGLVSVILLSVSLVITQIILRRKISLNKSFYILLIFLFLCDVVTSYALKTPITQYHTFSVLVVGVIIYYSIFELININKRLQLLIVTIFIATMVINYMQYIYPLWNYNGREDEYHLNGYKKIGKYVQQNTNQGDIFLAAETTFRYYARRDTIWLNESVGHYVRNILLYEDQEQAKEYIKQLDIKYIVINKEQTKRFGVSDYIPSNGIVNHIDNSDDYKKMYDPYGDGGMVVYKVNFN